MNDLYHAELVAKIAVLKSHREEVITTGLKSGIDTDAQCDAISDIICDLYAQCDVINGCS